MEVESGDGTSQSPYKGIEFTEDNRHILWTKIDSTYSVIIEYTYTLNNDVITSYPSEEKYSIIYASSSTLKLEKKYYNVIGGISLKRLYYYQKVN